jgi:hypothetical protein
MNQLRKQTFISLSLVVGVVGLMVAGCGTSSAPPTRGKVIAWNLQLTKKTPASITVDLIGLNKADDAYWRRGLKPDDYWNPNKPIRRQAQDRRATADFGTNGVWVLPRENEMWGKWAQYGSYELLIIANLTGNYSNDEFDARRQFLLLGNGEWKAKHKTLEVEILDGQIRVVTPPQP